MIDPDPSLLAVFEGVSPAAIETGEDPEFVRYHLSCKRCTAPLLALSWFEHRAFDPLRLFGIARGEAVQQGPIGTRCAACGSEATVFDPRRHGYDGVLNGGCSYPSGEGRQAFSDPLRVTVELVYNVDADDLDTFHEMAASAGSRPADLFDWIHVTGIAPDGTQAFAIDFECA